MCLVVDGSPIPRVSDGMRRGRASRRILGQKGSVLGLEISMNPSVIIEWTIEDECDGLDSSLARLALRGAGRPHRMGSLFHQRVRIVAKGTAHGLARVLEVLEVRYSRWMRGLKLDASRLFWGNLAGTDTIGSWHPRCLLPNITNAPEVFTQTHQSASL